MEAARELKSRIERNFIRIGGKSAKRLTLFNYDSTSNILSILHKFFVGIDTCLTAIYCNLLHLDKSR